MDTVLISAQDYDYGDFKEIPFPSTQTLFDFDLVMWDLRWLCYGYRFNDLDGNRYQAEPTRIEFCDGLRHKIIRDRERRIVEIENLMARGGVLVLLISIPIVFTFAEEKLDVSNSQIIDNYSFLPLELEMKIRENLIEGSGSKIEFRGDIALLPIWNKIKHKSIYGAYFKSNMGNPFLFIKNTNHSVGTWFSYNNGHVVLFPHTPDDGGEDYPAFMNAAIDFARIIRTKKPDITNESSCSKEEEKKTISKELPQSMVSKDINQRLSKTTKPVSTMISLSIEENRIQQSLTKISPSLGLSYIQVKADLKDENRTSWAGTAHEIREVLANLLKLLAPDDSVIKQPWYKQDPTTFGPTQKQRTRFILQQHNAGSKEIEVASQVSHLEEMIEDLVRAFYSRASDAAHQGKEKREVLRIVNYFDTFAQDLLDL